VRPMNFQLIHRGIIQSLAARGSKHFKHLISLRIARKVTFTSVSPLFITSIVVRLSLVCLSFSFFLSRDRISYDASSSFRGVSFATVARQSQGKFRWQLPISVIGANLAPCFEGDISHFHSLVIYDATHAYAIMILRKFGKDFTKCSPYHGRNVQRNEKLKSNPGGCALNEGHKRHSHSDKFSPDCGRREIFESFNI